MSIGGTCFMSGLSTYLDIDTHDLRYNADEGAKIAYLILEALSFVGQVVFSVGGGISTGVAASQQNTKHFVRGGLVGVTTTLGASGAAIKCSEIANKKWEWW